MSFPIFLFRPAKQCFQRLDVIKANNYLNLHTIYCKRLLETTTQNHNLCINKTDIDSQPTNQKYGTVDIFSNLTSIKDKTPFTTTSFNLSECLVCDQNRSNYNRIFITLTAGLAIFIVCNIFDKNWLKNHFIVYAFEAESVHNHELLSQTKNGKEEKNKQVVEDVSKKKKKIGFRERRIVEYENRLRAYSTPEKVFRYFATLKVAGDDSQLSMSCRVSDVYMTPEDFVRSLTPGVMQPRNLGLDKYKLYYPDKRKYNFSDKESIFYKLGEHGLINYHDYLFLLTLLSTPPQDFLLAFRIFDLNGDGELDFEEFEKVQELVLSQTMVGQGAQRGSVITLAAKRHTNSALKSYFFGVKSDKKLSIEKFLSFQAQLHKDILKIEFERRDPESYMEEAGIISEISFAELLLMHCCFGEKRQKRMLKRVRRKYKDRKEKKGVSLKEVYSFFRFLYYIDDVDLALHFYKLSGAPLTKTMIKKVAEKVANVTLSDNIVDIVITLFDENNDGCLSHKEFIYIMKKRMQRGLERPRDTGLFRLIDAISVCSLQQWDYLTID